MTYGDKSDFEIIEKNPEFNVLPIYSLIKKVNLSLLIYLNSLFILFLFIEI